MTWETAISGRLLAAVSVSGIIGNEVHWGVAPQGTSLPFVVLTVVSDPRPKDLEGNVSIRGSQIQIDCYANSRGGVADLREAVIDALDAAGTFSGVKFAGFFVNAVRELPEDTPTGTAHRMSIDATIWHTE